MGLFSKKGPTRGEVHAYKQGQDAAAEMAAAFKLYREQRFNPVHHKYLGVLRDGLLSILKDNERPPLLMCRAHLQSFEDNVNILREKMWEETETAMAEWLSFAREVGVYEMTVQTEKYWIKEFCDNLLNEGGAVIASYLQVVQDADNAWRRNFPVKAKEYYPEN